MHLTAEREQRLLHFERLCRQRGLARTIQRRAVFAALLERRDHPTADELYRRLRPGWPSLSRTTVYRVLETLCRAGIIGRAAHPGAATRYDPLPEPHHHLVCLRCGKITDLEGVDVGALPLPRLTREKFEVLDYCVSYRGLCAACRASTQKTRPEAGPGARRPKTRTGKRRVQSPSRKGENAP